MKVFLIRHGQSEANLYDYYAGQGDTPLTDLGREQAVALKPVLASFKFDRIYSSDLQRAAHTCENALPGASYEKLALLREYDVGSLTGKPLKTLGNYFAGDPAYNPDYREFGGENVAMVSARAEEFLQMLEKQQDEYVAVFSHYGFINRILSTVLNVAFRSKYIYTDNCAVHVIEYDGEKWRILALNYGMQV